MKTPNTIEDEVDAIRRQIHENTKHMTPAEHTEYYRKSGEAIAKELGIKVYANVEEARRDQSCRLAVCAGV